MSLETALPLLLSRRWIERKKGDLLLLEHFTSGASDVDPDCVEPWPEADQAVIGRLDPTPEIFVSALIAFWADQWGRAVAMRLKEIGHEVQFDPSLWQSDHSELFPLDDEPTTAAYYMYGLCVGRLLSRIGPAGSSSIRQLIGCLSHPDPVVVSNAISALGSVGPDARQAIPALVALAASDGLGANRVRLPRAIARIAGDSIELREELANRLTASGEVEVIAGACAILSQSPTGARSGLAAAIERLAKAEPDCVAELLWNAVRWAQAEGTDAQRASVLSLAMKYQSSKDERVRAASAGAIGRIGAIGDEATLLQVAGDAHPWVRGALAAALAERDHPPASVIRRIARNLGDYDGYDGSPHDESLNALVHWGVASRVASAEILAWLRAMVEKGYYGEQESVSDACRLANAVGAFDGVQHALRKILQAIESEAPQPEVDISEPGGVEALEQRVYEGALKYGTSEEMARATATFNAGMVKVLADSIPGWQAEIDAHEARQREELIEMFGERADHGLESLPAEPMAEEEPNHIVELRATIERLEAKS